MPVTETWKSCCFLKGTDREKLHIFFSCNLFTRTGEETPNSGLMRWGEAAFNMQEWLSENNICSDINLIIENIFLKFRRRLNDFTGEISAVTCKNGFRKYRGIYCSAPTHEQLVSVLTGVKMGLNNGSSRIAHWRSSIVEHFNKTKQKIELKDTEGRYCILGLQMSKTSLRIWRRQ